MAEVRDGMATLIGNFRSLVNDSDETSFDDERVQDILDAHRIDFYQEALYTTPQRVASGLTVYKVYTCVHGNLEAASSGTAAFRLYGSNGETISTGFTVDTTRGVFTFSADQAAAVRYLDGRSYDLYSAVADGWRERAGQQSGGFDFEADGSRFTRSQWFKHCIELANAYTKMGWVEQVAIERGDMI